MWSVHHSRISSTSGHAQRSPFWERPCRWRQPALSRTDPRWRPEWRNWTCRSPRRCHSWQQAGNLRLWRCRSPWRLPEPVCPVSGSWPEGHQNYWDHWLWSWPSSTSERQTSAHVWKTLVWYSRPWADVSSFRSCPEENTGPLAERHTHTHTSLQSSPLLHKHQRSHSCTRYDDDSHMVSVSQDVLPQGLQHGQGQSVPLLRVVQDDSPTHFHGKYESHTHHTIPWKVAGRS